MEDLPVVFETAEEVASRVHDGVLEVVHAGGREGEFLSTFQTVPDRVDVPLEVVARGRVHLFESGFDPLERVGVFVVAQEARSWRFIVDIDLEATICDFSHGKGDLPLGLGDDPVRESLG